MLKENFDKGREQVGQKARAITHQIHDKGFSLLRYKPTGNDNIFTRTYGNVKNAGLDYLQPKTNTALDYALDGTGTVLDNIGRETAKTLNPNNFTPLFTDPRKVAGYFSQYGQHLTRPISAMQEHGVFKGGFQHIAQKKKELVGRLNYTYQNDVQSGSFTEQGRHIAESSFGFVSDKASEFLGLAGSAFLVMGTGERRANTKAQLQSWLPKNYSMSMRGGANFAARQMIKPLARVKANPWVAASLMGYIALSKIGQNISDSQTLKEDYPERHALAVQQNNHLTNGSNILGVRQQFQEKRAQRSQSLPGPQK